MSLAFPLTSHMQFAIENKIERTLAEQDILAIEAAHADHVWELEELLPLLG
jgi:hypothetical protein